MKIRYYSSGNAIKEGKGSKVKAGNAFKGYQGGKEKTKAKFL